MSRAKPYFPKIPGAPPPLRGSVERAVRFEELDPLAIVWHGRYASYFEDARTALGALYGIGYHDFLHHEVLAPVRVLHVDYHRPLQFGEVCEIEARLHWSDACRINMDYLITTRGGEVATTGYSVQMLLDREENLLMVPPPFYQQFLDHWRAGTLKEVTPPAERPSFRLPRLPAFGKK